MKKWLLAFLLLLAPTAAFAQCTGVAPANTLCGNLTASPNVPGFYSASGAITGTVSDNYIPVGTATDVLGNGVYLVPVGGLTLYASPNGSGTKTCLSSGNSCTLPTACSMVVQVATFLGTVNIQLADGTYETADVNGNQCSVDGNAGGSSDQLYSINGDSTTPTNTVIAIQSGQNGIVVQDGGEAGINYLEFTNVNGGGAGITARQNAIVDYGHIYWGTWGNSGQHVAAYGNAVVVNPGAETLLASTTFIGHWVATQGAFILPNGTTTIQSSVAWTQFASATNANFDTISWTLSGTGTGQQFTGVGPGYLNTAGNASCASTFPGTGGCTISNGFITAHADLQTDGKLLNSAMPTPTRAGDIVYNNGSGWWQTLAGNTGTSPHLFFEDAGGNPGWIGLSTGMYNSNGIASRAESIDTYVEGVIGAVVTGKGGFTLWPVSATVDNMSFSSPDFTCSGNPTITMYECGTSTTCASPVTIGAITITAAHTVVSYTSLSSTAISAGDYTAWDLSGTCTALNPIGKAMVHMN